MKKILMILCLVCISGLIVFAGNNTAHKKESSTLSLDYVNLDISNGMIKVNGPLIVMNPGSTFGKDFFVVVRLTVSDTMDSEPVFSEDLISFDYPHSHPIGKAYPIHKEFPIDASGFVVKLIALDEVSGHEFVGRILSPQ